MTRKPTLTELARILKVDRDQIEIRMRALRLLPSCVWCRDWSPMRRPTCHICHGSGLRPLDTQNLSPAIASAQAFMTASQYPWNKEFTQYHELSSIFANQYDKQLNQCWININGKTFKLGWKDNIASAWRLGNYGLHLLNDKTMNCTIKQIIATIQTRNAKTRTAMLKIISAIAK